MARQVSVIVTYWFDGMHYWSDAPDEVGFLRHPHRHRFKVVAEQEVNHLDRDIEFFMLLGQLRQAVSEIAPSDGGVSYLGGMSCEMIADHLLQECGLVSCSVWEDGVNGALVKEARCSTSCASNG